VAVGFYLFVIAEDQYSSTVGFTVRQEEAGGASELLGGLASFAGGSTGSDRDILYEFIQSQGIVEQVDAKLDLTSYYAQNWEVDPVFSIWPDATIEDLVWFWQRVVRISYDQSTGLIEVQVLAFDPEMAQNIAKAIVSESQAMINALNTASRDDAMRYAQADLASAVERLKSAREALTRFRTRTQIVDPEADIQGRMGVVNNLQQQLAQALIDLDLLQETTNSTDPRVTRAEQRISVIRNRIDKERANFANSDEGPDAEGGDYPALIAEFESLSVDREFGEVSYRAALAALDLARANASRQSRYLAAYIQPTRAQSANFPQRGMLLGLTIILCLLSWAILALIYYSIRDRR
jgi:capsular polysaccharide transport system permease protein